MFETEEMFSFRDPFNGTYTVLGHCEMCGDEIRSDYEYFEEVKINITVDSNVYKLKYTNAENKKNNTYTWILNKNNCNNSEIILTLDVLNYNEEISDSNDKSKNNNKIDDYILYIFLGVLVLIILVIYKWFMKFKEKNNDIE